MSEASHETKKTGFKVNRVFALSMTFCVVFGIWGLVQPDLMTNAVTGFTSYFLTSISWYWLILCTGFVLLGAFMAFGPYSHIRLGDDDERPEFSTGSWIAMLFAGGMGVGLVFWGVAEPVIHFANPPGIEGSTAQSARLAMVITNLHWGLHAWSTYGVCALVIAYFTFRRKQKSMISTPILSLFGHGKAGRTVATTADTLGVIAVVFGLAGSLAMGVMQVGSGLDSVFGIEYSIPVAMMILLSLFVAYMLSATTGVDKGIKILSNLNMIIALFLMLFIIFLGPTRYIIEVFFNTIGEYFSSIFAMSFHLFPYEGLTSWSAGWTLTYLIWWLAWGPFVGIFVARISRGRTIREFCVGVILVPTFFSILWFATFGGSAIYVELFGAGGIESMVLQDISQALFAFFSHFPGSDILSVAAVVLIFIFLVTSADSGTFVLSMMTTEGNLNPPILHKVVWGVLMAVITAGTLFSGSVQVARAMAIAGALPFSIVLLLQVVGFMREIRKEVKEVRPPIQVRKMFSDFTR